MASESGLNNSTTEAVREVQLAQAKISSKCSVEEALSECRKSKFANVTGEFCELARVVHSSPVAVKSIIQRVDMDNPMRHFALSSSARLLIPGVLTIINSDFLQFDLHTPTKLPNSLNSTNIDSRASIQVLEKKQMNEYREELKRRTGVSKAGEHMQKVSDIQKMQNAQHIVSSTGVPISILPSIKQALTPQPSVFLAFMPSIIKLLVIGYAAAMRSELKQSRHVKFK